MTSASTPNHSPPAGGDEAWHASFRRGKVLTVVLAAVTGGYYFADTLHGYSAGGTPAKLSDLFFGWAVVGFLCWCILRGGVLASGCLIITCVPLVLGLVGGTVATFGNLLVPFGRFSFGVDEYHNLGSDWKSTFSFLPVGVWAAYACWVLLSSKDARVYRQVRREEAAEAHARNFEWPPAPRR